MEEWWRALLAVLKKLDFILQAMESQGRFLSKEMTDKRCVKEMPAAESLAWSGWRLEPVGGQLGGCDTSLESEVGTHQLWVHNMVPPGR